MGKKATGFQKNISDALLSPGMTFSKKPSISSKVSVHSHAHETSSQNKGLISNVPIR